jgi:hypothetical protein
MLSGNGSMRTLIPSTRPFKRPSSCRPQSPLCSLLQAFHLFQAPRTFLLAFAFELLPSILNQEPNAITNHESTTSGNYKKTWLSIKPSSFVFSPAPLNFYPVKSQRAISLGHAAGGTIQLGLILSDLLCAFAGSARDHVFSCFRAFVFS